ncbi:hypothetical protein M5689_013126 [Euphorbia peplus]|nr:hypothetical protein M5689_013126 [Euphorbia peplus]
MTKEDFETRQEARDRRIEAFFEEMRRANEANAEIERRINRLANEVNKIPDRFNEIFAKNANSHNVADNSKQNTSQRDPYRPPPNREENMRFNERGDRRSLEQLSISQNAPHFRANTKLNTHAEHYNDNNTRGSGGTWRNQEREHIRENARENFRDNNNTSCFTGLRNDANVEPNDRQRIKNIV